MDDALKWRNEAIRYLTLPITSADRPCTYLQGCLPRRDPECETRQLSRNMKEGLALTVTIAPLTTPFHRATTKRFCVVGLWRDAKHHASRAVEYVLCILPTNEANYVQPLAKPLSLCSLVEFPNPDDLRLIDGLEGFGDITTITSRCVQCEKQISTMPAFVSRPRLHGSQFCHDDHHSRLPRVETR